MITGLSPVLFVYVTLTGKYLFLNIFYFTGPYENKTCYNEYLFTAKFEKSWLNETPNRKHAISSHVGQKHIKYFTTLKFRCPSGMNFLGAKGLPVMESTCQQDGTWTKEWPMCKGLFTLH